MLNLGWGAGAIADYPWNLDGSKPWAAEDTISVFDLMGDLEKLGIRFIDTAFRYGGGLSEKIIGLARSNGFLAKALIFTKLEVSPSILEMEHAYELSCERLGGQPAGVFLHNPDLSISKSVFLAKACAWLKRKNLGFCGISTEPVREAVRIVEGEGMNCIQFPYSMFDRRAEEEILPYASKGILTMANRVLGGPTKELKSEDMIIGALRYVAESRARINVVLIGTAKRTHLEKVVEAWNGFRNSVESSR